jgi:hypothetical protein
VSQTVSVAEATNDEVVLPERVQEALGELVGAAKEGLLALSVGVALGVPCEMLEDEGDDVVGRNVALDASSSHSELSEGCLFAGSS